MPVRVMLLVMLVLLAGCAGDESRDPAGGDVGQRYPNVTEVAVTAERAGTYSFDVTISSPYDSPDRYADGWRILDPDGKVLAEMTLGHDHASEQPFTRTQTGVAIPHGVAQVTVQGRDTEHGYGGDTRGVATPEPR